MANALSVGDIKTYVRDYLDAEILDLPDSLFAVWIPEAYTTMVDADEAWPYFAEIMPNFQTVPLQDTYVNPLRTLEAIEGPMWALPFIDQLAAERMFPPSWVGQGQPQAFSFPYPDGAQFRLWPTPTAIYDLSLRGYRQPNDFMAQGDGATPDAPDEWHAVLARGVLASACAQQGDLESAAAFTKQFAGEVAELQSRQVRAPRPGRKVLNGGPSYAAYPPRLRYPWEPMQVGH